MKKTVSMVLREVSQHKDAIQYEFIGTTEVDGKILMPFALGRLSLPEGGQIETSEPFLAAARQFASLRMPFRLSDDGELATKPSLHADGKIIRDWLISLRRDSDEFDVIVWLARAIRSDWAIQPRRTPSQHRALFKRINELCIELRGAIAETGDYYMRGGGFGLRHATINTLLKVSEIDDLEAASDSTILTLPSIEDLLNRLADAANRLEKSGPMHNQPTKRGAERGYFVRRMGEIFAQRYGQQPCEVLAALTTIALGVETDRELVAKLLK